MREIKALIVDTPHIDNILSGRKTWEMRSKPNSYRGPMGLIRIGQPREIIGVVEMIDSLGPLSEEEMLANQSKHCMPPERIKTSKYRHAWVLRNAKLLKQPIPCQQTSQVIWVKLDEEVGAAVVKAVREFSK